MLRASGFSQERQAPIAGEARSVRVLRARRCKHCREKVMPGRVGQLIHDECAEPYAEKLYAKRLAKARIAKEKAAKVERAADRVKKSSFKRISSYIAAAQVEFNAYIRERDKDQPCICCGRGETAVDGLRSHGWDCGHYRSTGSASHLRFNENNAHRQLVYCNREGAGRAVDYRIGLIRRIGLAAVEALEADNTPHKWTREELTAIKLLYRAKLKELLAQRSEG